MMPNPEQYFRALADETRLRCITLLSEHDELCVCEFTHALGLPQPKVSHHLGNLRKAGLVADRKAGLWVYYRIHPDLPAWARAVIAETTAGVRSQLPFAGDRQALETMPNRPGTACCA